MRRWQAARGVRCASECIDRAGTAPARSTRPYGNQYLNTFRLIARPGNGSVFGLADVAAAIALFVSGEVALIDPLRRIGFLASFRHRALVAIIGMQVSIDVATKVAGAMKPRAR